VEDVIAGHPAVMEVAVLGKPHPEWGETVVACIVPREGQAPTPEELKEFLADKLANYKIPKLFQLVDQLPHTPTGKVMKFQLRNQLAAD
jgi:feruloyl-CoA synthase